MSFTRIGMAGATANRKPFEAFQLPLEQKRQLCLELLDEFGAENVTVKGNEIFHRCNLPFGNHAHGDTTGKAHLNFEKLVMSCWVCGGGGFLWWLSTMRGDDDLATREWLAKRTGIGGVQNADDLMKFLDSLMAPPGETPEKSMPRYDARILDKWAFIHPYLTEFRKIPAQNIIDSRVGYGTLDVKVGDRFVKSERIIIPHWWKGELVGWQSRRLCDDGTPKYLSTPSMPKDSTLFNHDPSQPSVVIVESPMSVIAQRHNAHMEATFGAQVTEHQMDLIARHGEIVLWMDQDPAGWNATEQLCEYLYKRTSRLFVIDCPYAADPADLDSASFAQGLIDWRVHWSMYQRPRSLMEWRREDHEHSEVLQRADDQ